MKIAYANNSSFDHYFSEFFYLTDFLDLGAGKQEYKGYCYIGFAIMITGLNFKLEF